MKVEITRNFQTLWSEWRGRWRLRRFSYTALRNAAVILQDVYGIRFILYPWNQPYLLHLVERSYDKTDMEAISLLVRKGDVVLDIGAHTGEYAVFLSRLCGVSGRVFAFEPVPETYWMLRENLALNRCENVVAAQKAICHKAGIAKMNLFEPQFSAWNTFGMPSMVTPEGKRVSPCQSVEVPTETLDDFCSAERIEQIDFLKVDVEGFEKFVFLGAERALRERWVNFICFEISQEPLRGAGVNSREVFHVLQERGYFAYRYDGPTRTFKGPVEDTSEYWGNFYASWRDLSNIRTPE